MNEIYIFDIDGTLTQPRQRMDGAFADTFIAFCQRWPVYLASGSDYPKIAEQVPEDIIERVAGIFPCAGAEFWQGPLCRHADDHQFPQGLVALFQSLMITSPYPLRFGAHVEKRTGMLNVSVVGRSADHTQRKAYRAWDDQQGERAAIATVLAEAFPAYEYAVGGDISIDIFPKGANKSRILRSLDRLHPNAAYRFFGDRTAAGGNDRPLAEALWARGPKHQVFSVNDCDETRRILDAIIASGHRLAREPLPHQPIDVARSVIERLTKPTNTPPVLSRCGGSVGGTDVERFEDIGRA